MRQLSPRAIFALLSCAIVLATASKTFNFNGFPNDSIHCIHNATGTSSCPKVGKHENIINACYCLSPKDFIRPLRDCLHRQDPDDLFLVWWELERRCDAAGVPIDYSVDRFINWGQATAWEGDVASIFSLLAASVGGLVLFACSVACCMGLGRRRLAAMWNSAARV